MFHTHGSNHLEISTHTHLHSCMHLSEYKFTLPKTPKKFFLVPNLKEFTEISLAWTPKITNLSKQSEVSRDILGYFLSCVYLPDDPQYAIITRVKKSMAGIYLFYKYNEQLRYNHHVSGKSNFQ